ncbi:MAG: hypothetical protein ACRDAM_15835 [Casimicrobium sp.]
MTDFNVEVKPGEPRWGGIGSKQINALPEHQMKITITAGLVFYDHHLLNKARAGKLSRNDQRRVKAQAARITSQNRRRT